MSDRLSELETRIAELTESHRQLETRLAALERRAAAAAGVAARQRARAAPEPDASDADLRIDAAAATKNMALVGRTLVVLAGGFLLRAVTDAGTIPTWMGVGLGFTYAGAWIAMAWRAGPAQGWSAGFHGLSAILIAFPLLFEATTRFHLLSPTSASALLAFFAAVALGVAARRGIEALAWLIEAGAIVVAVALVVETGRLAPPLLFLVALGVATLWLGYVVNWVYLRWPVALVADVVAVFLALRAVSPIAAEGPRTALLVQVALMGLYLGSIATRTLLLKRGVVAFEVVQTGAVMLVGLGGAAYITARSGMGHVLLGAVCVVFGLGAYAVAFAFVERQQRSRANFFLYASVALAFVLTGTGLLLSGALLSLGWAALAVTMAALARRWRRQTLGAHSVVCCAVAALQSGLLSHAGTTVFASAGAPWAPLGAAGLAVLAAIAASAALGAGIFAERPTLRQRAPRALVLTVLACSATGVATGWIVPVVAGAPGPGANLGLAATARTAVLVVGAVAVAWAGRRAAWHEVGWLAYPILLVLGLKLVVDDIARSRPASLFLAFALYGVALILVPRLRRRDAVARPPEPASRRPTAA
jgi:hypothetical protein